MSDKALQQSRGGQNGTFVAGAASETLVYTGAGRLQRLSIATVATQGVSIYDGTQSTGGQLMYTAVTNPTVGAAPIDMDLPFGTGLVVKGTSTASHGVFVSYNGLGFNGATTG